MACEGPCSESEAVHSVLLVASPSSLAEVAFAEEGVVAAASTASPVAAGVYRKLAGIGYDSCFALASVVASKPFGAVENSRIAVAELPGLRGLRGSFLIAVDT